MRPLPRPLWEKSIVVASMSDDDNEDETCECPKVQYIPGVFWECVVTDSVQKVTKEEQDDEEMLNNLLASMNLKG